jgi:hypothetical protein
MPPQSRTARSTVDALGETQLDPTAVTKPRAAAPKPLYLRAILGVLVLVVLVGVGFVARGCASQSPPSNSTH